MEQSLDYKSIEEVRFSRVNHSQKNWKAIRLDQIVRKEDEFGVFYDGVFDVPKFSSGRCFLSDLLEDEFAMKWLETAWNKFHGGQK